MNMFYFFKKRHTHSSSTPYTSKPQHKPYNRTTASHKNSYARAHRSNCLSLAQKHLSPTTQKEKVMKQYACSASGTYVKMYTAFVVAERAAEERVLMRD